MIYIEPTQKDR